MRVPVLADAILCGTFVKSRKQSWTREEVVLALDLFVEQGMATRADRDALSVILRALPIEPDLANEPSFRNWQAVRNKLYNPSLAGYGWPARSRAHSPSFFAQRVIVSSSLTLLPGGGSCSTTTQLRSHSRSRSWPVQSSS